MVSSLAAQLAKGASLNTTVLVDRSRRKSAESYLFTGREADQHDLESIHALGANGLLQLTTLNAAFRPFESPLFSDGSKDTDRTLLSAEAVAQLNASISEFLSLLGPYLTEAPTGKVLEWLVRRFRINEFNVEAVLALFLPYHESPHFAKMLSILHVQPNSTWNFLLPFKAATQNVPRISLVTEMLKNSDATRFIPSDEGTLAHLLPALLEPLQSRSDAVTKDAILGSYILLSALAQVCQFTSLALKTIINTMANCARRVSTKQFVNAVVSVCEAQEQLDTFTDGTGKGVLRLLNIKEELRTAEKWSGIEKFVSPLLTALCRRTDDEAVPPFLESIIGSPTAPTIVVKHLANLLIGKAVSDDAQMVSRRLLSHIQQRHPLVLQEAADELSRSRADLEDSVDNMIVSLSVAAVHTADPQNEVGSLVASMSADERVRAAAVKELFKTVASQDPDAAELQSVRAALMARVQDTSSIVLGALYAEPSQMVSIFLDDPKTYLDSLSGAIMGSKPKRQVLRLHLVFLATHFCSAATPALLEDVFHKVLFPFLLFSKTRQHTADLVWEIIEQNPATHYELLGGCATLWMAEKGKDGAERMANINQAVSSKLAENIMASDHYHAHFSALIRMARDTDPHVRVLAYLVIRALLVRLSGERQIDAAAQALEAINLQQLPDIDTSSMGSQTLPEFLNESNLGKMVVHKLTSKNTTHWLQVSILALVSTIPRPANLILDWFTDDSSLRSDGPVYVKLMRTVYQLANSSAFTPLLTVGLLRELFINLKDDALGFLAGLWTTYLESAADNFICVVALRHAAAFLEAHREEADGVDFQTILPSLVICLQSNEVETRAAALDCVTSLRNLAEQRFSAVYAFDTIYGKSESQLQYLSQNDLKKYLDAVVDHREHLSLDAAYVKVFHAQHLARSNADKKKDSEYKHRVLCYLLSHVQVLSLVSARIALLRSIGDISDKSKTEVLLPALVALNQDDKSMVPDSPAEQFASLLVASFDLSASPALNDPKGSLWGVFISVLQHYLKPGPSTACRVVLLHSLEHGLIASLTVDRKVEVCNLLFDVGTKDADMYPSSKKLLSTALQDIPLVVRLLASTRPEATTTSPRASKRAKLTDVSDDTFPRLSLLAEVLGSIPLPGSFDLISRLLETLHNVVQSTTTTDADISYIEQSLMSAVEHSAEKIVEVPNLAPSAIRLDILVELIRVAENPQTFNQALLLMATLARLSPDSVLHNVMPVFTFMGSNVFHRDDSYSFKVVQKTIDSIVPFMASSLKSAHSARLDLYIASRDFLRVFTDAANHIPRHRRTSFFGHLADVLGPIDFLPPLCMLLVEKLANRVVRQAPEEVQNLLVLPISVLHRYPPALQTFILTEVLREAQRLTVRAADPENLEPSLLDTSPDEDQLQPSAAAFKRRAQALVVFVGYATKISSSVAQPPVTVPEGGAMSNLVSLLIALATAQGGSSPDTRVEDISHAARVSLSKALGCMSAVDFIDAVLSIMKSGDSKVQGGALDLLAERLHDVASTIRLKVTARVNECVEEIRKLLLLHPDGPLTASSYKALQSIAGTMSPGEEGSLTTLIPPILATIRGRKMAEPAMGALAPLSVKLGPRLIPFFRDIVTQCVALLREGVEGVATETLNVLHGLLTSIPTFWGPAELTQVCKLYIDHYTSSTAPLTSLMKTVAKRAPTAVLITALTEMWPSLRASPQTDRLENVRSLFNVFLEGFSVEGVSIPKSEAEDQAISAFIELVVKLNEASFRPLFRKLYDWGFADDGSNIKRKITFCNVYSGLLDFFKGLMNPYMSFLVQPFVTTLKDYSGGTLADPILWTGILDIFTKSLISDDGAFWREDKLRLASPALVQQAAVCVRLGGSTESKALVTECLVALTDSVADDALLKTLNLDLLMHTRSDDARLRVFALSCASALWNAHGGKLLGFVSETTTFIAECSEDEHDMVVRESLRLKNAVESVAGNISGL
ncbi:hypothetical protein FB451DRAFT_1275210 [Mycena latifolia]|nr:hypothetical protein FB451DRAFT_1275210 [Mycena latifolia]